MAIILIIYVILVIFELLGFIKRKESVKVIIINSFFILAGLTVSLLLASGKRPPSPAKWIEWMLKTIGVVK